jgi:CheY-like chemotaxis protein
MKNLDLAIMAVDDERIILDSLRGQLERNFGQTYLLEFAETGNEAMELAESIISQGIKVLLVISDYMMPGMHGDDFARNLKAKYPEIDVVMLTGLMPKDKSDNLLDAKVVMRVINKPWREEELVSTIKEIESRRVA